MKKYSPNYLKLFIILPVIGVMVIDNHILADNTLVDNQTVSSSPKEDLNSWMPDKNLQIIVAQSLLKTVSDLTKSDMSRLTTVDFGSLPKNTEVNLTGLDLATNLKNLFTTNIIATNIPQISIASNGTLFTLPNVLKHITPQGKLSNIHIGNYDTFLPASDLVDVGNSIENWQATYLTVYATEMTDYSSLNLPVDIQENSYVSILDNEESILKPIEIKDNVSELLYSDENVKDTSGNLLLSSLSNADYPFYLTAFNKEGMTISLTEGSDYSLTNDGIQFNNIPADLDYIKAQGIVPALFPLSRNANIAINYGTSFKIPVKYIVSAKDITVKYVDTEDKSIPGSKDVTLTGYVGEGFKTELKTFEGYTFLKVVGDQEGTFSDQPQTIKYIYSKDPIKAQNIIIKYLDTRGNKIHEDSVISGNIGDSYDVSSNSYKIALEGYTLDEEKLPLNSKGVLTAEEQTVVYVYNKKDSQTGPSNSKSSTITSNQSSNSKSSTIISNQSSNSQAEVLPETGENNRLANVLLDLGIFMLIILSLLQIERMRKRKHN